MDYTPNTPPWPVPLAVSQLYNTRVYLRMKARQGRAVNIPELQRPGHDAGRSTPN
jgi:hypothetical protein